MLVSMAFVCSTGTRGFERLTATPPGPNFVQQNISQDQELFPFCKHYRCSTAAPGRTRRYVGRYEQRRSLDARVSARLATRVRGALCKVQRAALRILPPAAGKSAARGGFGPGNFSCGDSRCAALRAASAGADVLVRSRAEDAGGGAAQTAWKRRQSRSSP